MNKSNKNALDFINSNLGDIRENPSRYRIMSRVPLTDLPPNDASYLPFHLSDSVGDEVSILFLDCETTGLSYKTDEIIQLGLVRCKYSPSELRLVSIEEVHSYYRDPKKPIPAEITRITGITDDMVSGHVIPDDVVKDQMSKSVLIAAHNAPFDAGFFLSLFPQFKNKPWVCTASEVDWSALGYESRKLEYLLYQHDAFYGGHDASIDCLALAWLFACDQKSFASLIQSARTRTAVVHALSAPFDVKDALSANGYRWDDGTKSKYAKHWYKSVPLPQLENEKAWLQSLYPSALLTADFELLDATTRYLPN